MQQSTKISLVPVLGIAVATIAAVWYFRADRGEEALAMLGTVCADCHNDVDLAGELSFEGMTPESIAEHPDVFETVAARLRGGFMPPPGAEQPERSEIESLIRQVERTLDDNAAGTVGYVRAQRLSRTEYAHAVEGLLGVVIDPTEYLPTENEVEGFTNIASGLSVSPAFIEQYVNVARTVAHLAVGEPVPKVAAAYFPPPGGNQSSYIDGFPLGTRGGIRIRYTFPADGEYRVTLKNLGVGLYPRAMETEHTLVILVDDEELFRRNIGGPEDLALANRGGAPAHAEIKARFADIPLNISAGEHDIIITFIERSRAASDEHIENGRGFTYAAEQSMPGIAEGVDLVGPFNATGVSRTASREKVFVCEPEVPAREHECAEQIAADLARRAYRRPVTETDLDHLMPFFEEGRRGPGGFDEGIELMLTAILASPDFLYRTITPDDAASESRAFALDDFELASRLSFFVWSQGPDDRLLELAASGELSDPATLDAEVARMLDDPRAEVLVSNFALPWLDLDDLDAVEPDSQIFAGAFNESLRSDFAGEIRAFLNSILLEDEDVRTLLTADHTFLNERLARHYGIDGVFGPQLRRIELDDPERFGLLGKAAFQLRTSYGDRTSPVLRGAWVLEKLLGTPPTPPPPGVETDLTTPEGEEPKTIRARLENHRANPNCAACHGAIDPYGLALENFDVIGRWRDEDREAHAAIDASTELPDGAEVEGPVELTEALLRRPDQFVWAMTQKLMMYALGRELEYYDMPAVRSVVREAEADGYRFADIVAGIVQTDAFRMQGAASEGSEPINVAFRNDSGGRIDEE